LSPSLTLKARRNSGMLRITPLAPEIGRRGGTTAILRGSLDGRYVARQHLGQPVKNADRRVRRETGASVLTRAIL